MLKTILLLTPIYVTFFWTILLHVAARNTNHAKRFLGKFMLACIFVYIGHFLYFNNVYSVIVWYEPFYQFFSLLVYPLFYIYFRLLMLEVKFEWKKHIYFLITPFILFVLYFIAAYSLPKSDFLYWIYNKDVPSENQNIQILNVLRKINCIVFVLQVVFSIIGNLSMIRNFRLKAIQFYSDYWEIRSVRVVILNILMVICSVSSIVLSVLGRKYFTNELVGLTIASVIFSISLFIIGWIGIQQKVINPTLTENADPESITMDVEMLDAGKMLLAEKINKLFVCDKVYLNNKLNIQDVAQHVGTNRTYISTIINNRYGMNFCTFVNNHRLEELERLLKNRPDMTNQNLAESCGFGSVDSLKRAVNQKTGLSVTAYKRMLFKKAEKEAIF